MTKFTLKHNKMRKRVYSVNNPTLSTHSQIETNHISLPQGCMFRPILLINRTFRHFNANTEHNLQLILDHATAAGLSSVNRETQFWLHDTLLLRIVLKLQNIDLNLHNSLVCMLKCMTVDSGILSLNSEYITVSTDCHKVHPQFSSCNFIFLYLTVG